MKKTQSLGRFVHCVREPVALSKPVDVAQHVMQHIFSPFSDFLQEELWVLAINARGAVTHHIMVSRGTSDASLAQPSIVFREAIVLNASSVIISHNHPSGVADPSSGDLLITKRLVDCGKLLGIPVRDHVIVGKDSWNSVLGDQADTLSFRDGL